MATNLFYNQTETILDKAGNPVSLKEILRKTMGEKQKEMLAPLFLNTNEPVGGSIEAGQFRYIIGQLLELIDRENEGATTKKSLNKAKVREFLLKTMYKKDVPAQFIKPTDQQRYLNIEGIIKTAIANAPIVAFDKAVFATMVAGTTNAVIALGTTATGDDIYQAVKASVIKLASLKGLTGTTANEEFYDFAMNDIAIAIDWEAIGKIMDVNYKLGAGSETQYSDFWNAVKADGILVGAKFKSTNRLPAGTLFLVTTIGENGSTFGKYEIRPFAEKPELTGGALAIYAEVDALIDVAHNDLIIVGTTDTPAGTEGQSAGGKGAKGNTISPSTSKVVAKAREIIKKFKGE